MQAAADPHPLAGAAHLDQGVRRAVEVQEVPDDGQLGLAHLSGHEHGEAVGVRVEGVLGPGTRAGGLARAPHAVAQPDDGRRRARPVGGSADERAPVAPDPERLQDRHRAAEVDLEQPAQARDRAPATEEADRLRQQRPP